MSLKKLFSDLSKSKVAASNIELTKNHKTSNVNENVSDVPEIIQRFRENYSNVDDKTLVKRYFELLNKMRENYIC